MKVFMPGEWPEGEVSQLASLVPGGVSIYTGEYPPVEGFEILIAGRPTRAQIEASPILQWLVIPWAGLPRPTGELMKQYPQIAVHNLHHNAGAVSELAIGLLLCAARKIVVADRALRKGNWALRYRQEESVLIEGNRALVLGYGEIGRRVAELLRALGARVDATKRSAKRKEDVRGVIVHPPSDLHSLIPGAYFVILCLPMTPETDGLIGEYELALMHEKTILVNVGRAELVQEQPLFDSLKNHRIGAAAMDVWYNYPFSSSEMAKTRPSSAPFWELDNVVMVPHIGGAYGVPALEKKRVENLAVIIRAAYEGTEVPWRIDLNLGY